MLLDLDILARLHRRAETPTSLAGVLNSTELEIKARLASLEQAQMVKTGVTQYAAPTTASPALQLGPNARRLYGPLFDHFSSRHGPAKMSTFERFLATLSDGRPLVLREAIAQLFNSVPREESDADRRASAQALAAAAVEYAEEALKYSGRQETATALRRVPRYGIEELDYVGRLLLSSEYAGSLTAPAPRDVLEHASRACNAAWDLRPLGPHLPGTNVSLARQPSTNTSSYAVGEESALALAALALCRPEIDLIAKARTIIFPTAPTPAAAAPG